MTPPRPYYKNTQYDERSMDKRTQIDLAIASINWYLTEGGPTHVGVIIQDFAHRTLIGNHVGLVSPPLKELRDQLIIKKEKGD